MKGLALAVLCFVAVQARNTGLRSESSRVAASLGENPWLVHLRVAVSTSGFLNSCAGSMIDDTWGSWVLTSASCIQDARFIWARFGVVDVASPERVLETSSVHIHPNWNPATGANDIAIIGIHRYVEHSDNIQPISASDDVPSTAKFCAWGSAGSNAPGEVLDCVDVDVTQSGDNLLISSQATRFDRGAPLVRDGVQIGLLTDPSRSEFLRPALYRDWIDSVVAP